MKTNWLKQTFTLQTLQDLLFITSGALVQSLAMRLFLIPSLLSSGGISGIAQILEYLFRTPVGLVTLLGNVPLFILGWRYLGATRFAARTIITIVLFSVFTDLLVYVLPSDALTSDLFLDTIYGGVLLGVGIGLVYRGKGTSGGTDILVRIMDRYLGIPLSTGFLIADGLVVAASGLAFGWDRALYGLVVIYISGLAAGSVSEGSGVFRAATIITNEADQVSNKIMESLDRGVTHLAGKGAWSKEEKTVLYCVLTRSEVNQLKTIVSEIDPQAFIVIGQVHETLGEGFNPLKEE